MQDEGCIVKQELGMETSMVCWGRVTQKEATAECERL